MNLSLPPLETPDGPLIAGSLVLLWSPKKGDHFLIRLTPKATQGTHLGQLDHDNLIGQRYGDCVLTNSGNPFFLLKPTLGEYTRRLKRQTQIVFPKDAGFILLHLDIFPGATVVECGTGSGSLTCCFAHFVGENGHVFSYERRQEFADLAKSNAERWGVADRISFKVRELAEGFDEKGADAVFLDLRDPWNYVDAAWRTLFPGRRIGILVPTYNQIEATLQALQQRGFADITVLELLLRELKTDPNRIRPEDLMIGHTGFLIFASKTLIVPSYERIFPKSPLSRSSDEERKNG